MISCVFKSTAKCNLRQTHRFSLVQCFLAFSLFFIVDFEPCKTNDLVLDSSYILRLARNVNRLGSLVNV